MGESLGIRPSIIQIGRNSFRQPPLAQAEKRINEIWRPGTVVVVVTTNHFGTPLFCPNGDFTKGLVNLTPSGKSPQELMLAYWQNIDDQRSSQKPTVGMERMLLKPMPTHLEEEDESDEQVEAEETSDESAEMEVPQMVMEPWDEVR